MIGSTGGMDQESHLAHDNSYANDHWVDMNAYNHMTMPGYGGEYSFIPPTSHGLPSESTGNHMPPPPVPQPIPQHQHQPQYTHPLIIPSQARTQMTWPSMQTNPGQSYSAPPVAIPPHSAPPLKRQPKVPSLTTSQPRKMLTDDDRRRMCQYSQENPTVKQSEIGARFGVERSTVSKVLRQKEKYLNQEERSSSPVKRPKGKNTDIERALMIWVRNQIKKGLVVSDEEMIGQARAFFQTTENPENYLKVITSSWLEKFKHKHNIGPGKLIRRASETAIPDSNNLSTDSPSLSASQTPGGISPVSPTGQSSPPANSGGADGKETVSGFADFASVSYKHPGSQSTTSLSSAVTDAASSSFSGSGFSPTSQFNFSPDVNTGMFDENGLGPGSSNFQRPRSQTFPTLDLEYLNQSQTSEPLTPKYSVSATAPSSAIESPAPPYGLDTAISPPTLHHSRSNSSLGQRSTNTPILQSAVASSPNSPTQEDARRAADTLLSFFMNQIGSNSLVNNEEYLTIVRLTEKLRLHQQQHQTTKSSTTTTGIGGLSRIPEGDTEMTGVSNNLIKNEVAINNEQTMTR